MTCARTSPIIRAARWEPIDTIASTLLNSFCCYIQEPVLPAAWKRIQHHSHASARLPVGDLLTR
eukprot:1466801-Pyramimonas_sp.AAC.1